MTKRSSLIVALSGVEGRCVNPHASTSLSMTNFLKYGIPGNNKPLQTVFYSDFLSDETKIKTVPISIVTDSASNNTAVFGMALNPNQPAGE